MQKTVKTLPHCPERVQKSRNYRSALANAPYSFWMALFIVVPMIFVVYYAFTDTDGSFVWFYNFVDAWRFRQNFWRSFAFAIATTFFTLMIGYPFAYFMTKQGKYTQRMMMALVMLPMWMNFLIRTYAWRNILDREGLLNNFIALFGIESQQILGTPYAVILGMVYNFLPFMIIPLYTILSKIDKSVLEASSDLGANGWNKFRRIILPLSMPGIITGVTLVLVPALSTFYIAAELGNQRLNMAGDMIAHEMRSNRNYNLGAAMSLVLMVVIFACLMVMISLNHYFFKRKGVNVG